MMNDFSKLESSKKELQLSVNSFDNPTELTDVKAWSQLVLQLIFLDPGTFPSYPEMGVGIRNYEFEFMDDVMSELSAKILNQKNLYLKDLPLSAVTINKTTIKGEAILLIQLTFTVSGQNANSVIAINASPSSRHFLDFEISW